MRFFCAWVLFSILLCCCLRLDVAVRFFWFLPHWNYDFTCFFCCPQDLVEGFGVGCGCKEKTSRYAVTPKQRCFILWISFEAFVARCFHFWFHDAFSPCANCVSPPLCAPFRAFPPMFPPLTAAPAFACVLRIQKKVCVFSNKSPTSWTHCIVRCI